MPLVNILFFEGSGCARESYYNTASLSFAETVRERSVYTPVQIIFVIIIISRHQETGLQQLDEKIDNKGLKDGEMITAEHKQQR